MGMGHHRPEQNQVTSSYDRVELLYLHFWQNFFDPPEGKIYGR